MRRLLASVATCLPFLLSGCGGGSAPASGTAATSDCSVAGQNKQILAIMQSWYYWYRSLPASVNPAAYNSTNAFLDALRQQPLDRFSFITTQAADQAYYGAGQYVGFGLGFDLDTANNLVVTQVFPGSPAAQAGLQRGDTVTAVNDIPVPTLVATNRLESELGAGTLGVRVTLTYTSLEGRSQTVALTSAVVTEPTVSQVQVLSAGREKVGYILFNSFIDPSNAALDQAFAQFASQGVTQLVIDERYNGGGELSVAQHLASLIVGNAYVGKRLATLTFNDKHQDQNVAISFQSVGNSLNLTQVLFITTYSSASASEFIINGLDPYLHVVKVGSATFGKPVGENGFNFCTNVLYPITFKSENVTGYGDYFDGLQPTCAATDDLTRALGDPDEASLTTALGYVRNGNCGPLAARAARANAVREALRPREAERYGWRRLLNAY